MIKILCSGDYYVVDAAYKRGALAARNGLTRQCNPYYGDVDKAIQWDRGYIFEENGEHNKLGIDVILATALYAKSWGLPAEAYI